MSRMQGLRILKIGNILTGKNNLVKKTFPISRVLIRPPNINSTVFSFQTRTLGLSSIRLVSESIPKEIAIPNSDKSTEIATEIVNDIIEEVTKGSIDSCITKENVLTEQQTVTNENSIDNELIFEIPDKPVPVDVTEMVGEPAFESLGLSSWWPSGRFQYFMETLHVSLDFEWWQVIMATTICVRVLVFPIVVMAQRNMANFNNNSPQMVKLQDDYTAARQRGDTLEAARIGMDLQTFTKKQGLNPLKNIAPMAMQMPIFMSMFFALRGMANLPVASMKDGGLFWFTNLTLSDPFYLLPILTSSTLYLQFRMGAEGAKLENMTPVMKGAMTIMPFILLPVTVNFPCAVNFYWFCTNIFSVIQAKVIRIPAIRTKLNIPELIQHKKIVGPKKSFKQGLHDTIDNWRLQTKIVDRRKYDEQMFKEAGTKKPGKYFKYDPTKPVVIKHGKKI